MLIWFTLWPSISRYLYSFYICLASLCRGCIKLVSIIHTPCTNKFLKVLEYSLHPINHKIAKGNSLKYRLNVSFEGAMVSAEVSLAISTARILYFVCRLFQFVSIYAKNTMSIKILKFKSLENSWKIFQKKECMNWLRYLHGFYFYYLFLQ